MSKRQKMQIGLILILGLIAFYMNVLKKQGGAPTPAPAPVTSTTPGSTTPGGTTPAPGGTSTPGTTQGGTTSKPKPAGPIVVKAPKGNGGYPGSAPPRGVRGNPFTGSSQATPAP